MTSLLSKIQSRLVGNAGLLSSDPYTPDWLAFALLAERAVHNPRVDPKEGVWPGLSIWARAALDKPLSTPQLKVLLWLDQNKDRRWSHHRQTQKDGSDYLPLSPNDPAPNLQRMFDVLAAEGKWKLCGSILKEHPDTLENSALLVSALSKIPQEQWPSPQHPMFAMCASEGAAFLTNKLLNLAKLVKTNAKFSDDFSQLAVADFNALTQILNHMDPVARKSTWSDKSIPESLDLLEQCEPLQKSPEAYGAFNRYRQAHESMPNRIRRDRLNEVVSTLRPEAFQSPSDSPKPSTPDLKM